MSTVLTFVPKTAEKLRTIAASLEAKAKKLDNPHRLENTPKRQLQGMSARCEMHNILKAAAAADKLADAICDQTIPAKFDRKWTAADLLRMTHETIDHSSYYVVRLSGTFSDMSHEAVTFREWLATNETPEERAKRVERAKADHIAELRRKATSGHIPGFHPTPKTVVDMMLNCVGMLHGRTLLEPSAGAGDIALAAMRGGATVKAYEINADLADLCRLQGVDCECRDFLDVDPKPEYDCVVMNPPFEKDMAPVHIAWALEALKPGGVLLSIAPANLLEKKGKKTAQLIKALEKFVDQWSTTPLGPDSFKSNDGTSTGVSVVLFEAIAKE